jgi:hypothetical protein
MAFRIEGLDPARFASLFAMESERLAEAGVITIEADDDDYPCRIALAGAAKGDRLLLLNHEHQPARTPYRSAHAIYVARGSRKRGVFLDEIPPIMASRTLSIRAFDADDIMIDADLVEGAQAAGVIERLFANAQVGYLHIHFAKRGCFAAEVHRT